MVNLRALCRSVVFLCWPVCTISADVLIRVCVFCFVLWWACVPSVDVECSFESACGALARLQLMFCFECVVFF